MIRRQAKTFCQASLARGGVPARLYGAGLTKHLAVQRPLHRGLFWPTPVCRQQIGGPDEDINVEWTSADYYKRLGLTPEATSAAIRERYLTLAKRYHPDASGQADNAAAFTAIKEAYETLIDDTKRKAYDGLGHRAYHRYKAQGFQFNSEEDFIKAQAVTLLQGGGILFALGLAGSLLLFCAMLLHRYWDKVTPMRYLAEACGVSLLLDTCPRPFAALALYMVHMMLQCGAYEATLQSQAQLLVTLDEDPSTSGDFTEEDLVLAAATLGIPVKAPSHKRWGATPPPAPALVPAEVMLEASGLGTAAEEAQMVVEVERRNGASEGDGQAAYTLVFPRGVHRVVFPLLLHSVCNEDGEGKELSYNVRARVVNDELKLTLLDKTVTLP